MTTTLQHTHAWPFLVGRGRHEGYRTLLAPSFLIERDLYETLSDKTPSVPYGELGRSEFSCDGLGALSVAYTTEPFSRVREQGANHDAKWTDEHGRPLEMLYGVVAQEPLSETLAISDLRRAR